MSASNNTPDPLLRRWYAGYLTHLMPTMPDFTTPEWRAWAEEWREEVPLTAEQRRENAEWLERVKAARAKLAAMQADFLAGIEALEDEFDVEVVGEEPAYDVDDYTPPHRPTYRTKDGAPSEPQMMTTIRFVTGGASRKSPMT